MYDTEAMLKSSPSYAHGIQSAARKAGGIMNSVGASGGRRDSSSLTHSRSDDSLKGTVHLFLCMMPSLPDVTATCNILLV